MNFQNTQEKKWALITGAARRIGRKIAEHLHTHGFHLIVHCNSSLKDAQDLVAKCNAKKPQSAVLWQQDLCSSDLVMQIKKHFASLQRLDLLVNNASIFLPTSAEVPLSMWQALFALHVQAPFALSQCLYKALRFCQGSIVNITDIHAQKPLSGYSVYCQSKAALEMQTKSLAKEFAPWVRVNAIAPGAILWPEGENTLTRDAQKRIMAKTPLQRHGDPLFIAEAVLQMATNPFITGQILQVDGGRSIG